MYRNLLLSRLLKYLTSLASARPRALGSSSNPKHQVSFTLSTSAHALCLRFVPHSRRSGLVTPSTLERAHYPACSRNQQHPQHGLVNDASVAHHRHPRWMQRIRCVRDVRSGVSKWPPRRHLQGRRAACEAKGETLPGRPCAVQDHVYWVCGGRRPLADVDFFLYHYSRWPQDSRLGLGDAVHVDPIPCWMGAHLARGPASRK